MSEVKPVVAELTQDKRQSSAPCSDYINNTRMASETPQEYENASFGKKEVETWLNAEVEADYSPDAMEFQGRRTDRSESPKRIDAHSALVFDQSGEEGQEQKVAIPCFASVLTVMTQMDREGGLSEVSDVYEQQVMEEAKKLQEASQKEYRFSMNDIFNNPALEDAAKQELRDRPPLTPSASNVDSVISLTESRVSHMEQTICNSENLDRDADRDLQAGHSEMAALVDRLNIGKVSCMNLLKFVQKLYQAEVAYSRSLLAVSRMSMANIGQTDGFRYASEILCELPMASRGAHSKIAQILAEAESSLNSIIHKIKTLQDSLMTESPKLVECIRTKRHALSRSKSRHQLAYKQMDSISENGVISSRVTDDPWLTEGQVAHDYTQLMSGQVDLKAALSNAYERVTEVELLRLQSSKMMLASLVESYSGAIDECVTPFVNDVNKALQVLDAEEEIRDLKKSQRNSQVSEQALRTQSAEQETTKCGELFASPDIIRQGPLQILDEETRGWVNARFVLTQAGLYWFMPQNTSPRPDDYLTLSRTSIEQAKAPGLKLIQDGNSYFSWKRAVILRASSIDEYCEWAIALREAIQTLTGIKK